MPGSGSTDYFCVINLVYILLFIVHLRVIFILQKLTLIRLAFSGTSEFVVSGTCQIKKLLLIPEGVN